MILMEIFLIWTHYFDFCVFSGEVRNTNFIVFGLTQPGLELTIYRIRGDHATITPSMRLRSRLKKLSIMSINNVSEWSDISTCGLLFH
jgi:hypothetical protein